MKKILERDIQKDIKDWCKGEDLWHTKISQRFQSGHPDTETLVCGFTLYIELKIPGKDPTPLQIIQLNKIRAGGGISGVAKSLGEFVKMVMFFRANPSITQFNSKFRYKGCV